MKFAKGETHEIHVNAQRPRPEIWLNRSFHTNGAHAKVLAIVLSYHEPVDLLTDQRVDVEKALAWTNAKEFHHFFPKEYLKKRNMSSAQSNCLANIIMLSSASNKNIANRAPSDYLRDVATAAGNNLESWLASHLDSIDAYHAALNDNFDSFLKLRA